MPKVRLFANFREEVGAREVTLQGDNVKELLSNLTRLFPGVKKLLFKDSSGELQPYINIFVDGVSIHELKGLETPLAGEEEVAIFPPVSGG